MLDIGPIPLGWLDNAPIAHQLDLTLARLTSSAETKA
jgi:hypothetical protein